MVLYYINHFFPQGGGEMIEMHNIYPCDGLNITKMSEKDWYCYLLEKYVILKAPISGLAGLRESFLSLNGIGLGKESD